jgi:hypothetical protein
MRRLLFFDEAPPLETPLVLLAMLREIDSTVELVHFGESQPIWAPGRTLQDWRLGSVRMSDERQKTGRVILEAESRRMVKNMRNVLLGRLALQGFAQIAQYYCTGTPGQAPCYDEEGQPISSILEDFQARDDAWRRDQGASEFARKLALSCGDAEREEGNRILSDMLHTDGRAEFRRTQRGTKLFDMGGH